MKFIPKKGTPCVLYDKVCTECGECLMCDLEPQKKCNNCGKCLEAYMPQTDEKGFVQIMADFESDPDTKQKEKMPPELKSLLSNYGLSDDNDE